MNYDNMGSSDRKEVRPPAGESVVPVTPLPLARQSSVYSLTLDEFQNSMGGIGKDFGSMNMDEFLKNIWTAEESQAMASAAVGGGGGDGPIDGLQRQGSLTLPRTLSQKTVDEVWRGLVGGQPDFQQQQQQQQQQRQPTLGEMTLEEFLVRAGVVREDINQQALSNTTATSNNNNGMFYSEFPASNSNSDFSFGFTQPGGNNGSIATSPIPNNGRPYTVPLPLGNNPDLTSPQGLAGGGIMGIADPTLNNGLMPGVAGLGGGGVTVAAVGSPANLSSSDGLMKGNGDLSSLSPVPYVFSGGMRGRKSSGAVEKVVERRQRRMIKNRESAARSRARKQAYTMELEAEVATLKEQNEDLQKKQAEIMEMQKNRVLEMINQQHGPKKQCLRRTQTGPW